MGLTIYEGQALREARDLLRKKPEDALKYLAGSANDTPKKALLAIALSAVLEATKQHHEMLKLSTAVMKFIVTEEKEDGTTTEV